MDRRQSPVCRVTDPGQQAQARTTAQVEMSSPLVGRPAESFELPDAEDRVHRLDEYRGRWLLLVLHRHLF